MADLDLILNEAIRIAISAHYNQMDKNGNPYILHPLRVMTSLQEPIDRVVGVLHDVLEDSNFVLSPSIPNYIIKEVKYLTRTKGISYTDYIKEIKKHPIATRVKIADLKDNLSPSRINSLDTETIKRLKKKYESALQALAQST